MSGVPPSAQAVTSRAEAGGGGVHGIARRAMAYVAVEAVDALVKVDLSRRDAPRGGRVTARAGHGVGGGVTGDLRSAVAADAVVAHARQERGVRERQPLGRGARVLSMASTARLAAHGDVESHRHRRAAAGRGAGGELAVAPGAQAARGRRSKEWDVAVEALGPRLIRRGRIVVTRDAHERAGRALHREHQEGGHRAGGERERSCGQRVGVLVESQGRSHPLMSAASHPLRSAASHSGGPRGRRALGTGVLAGDSSHSASGFDLACRGGARDPNRAKTPWRPDSPPPPGRCYLTGAWVEGHEPCSLSLEWTLACSGLGLRCWRWLWPAAGRSPSVIRSP